MLVQQLGEINAKTAVQDWIVFMRNQIVSAFVMF